MAISDILASIDRDLAQLQRARAALVGGVVPTGKRKPGRPKKVFDVATVATTDDKPARKKRKLSAAGRKRIAEAAKKRWAEQKAVKK